MPPDYEITSRYPTETLDANNRRTSAIAILWRSTAHPQITGSVTVAAALAQDKVAYAEQVDAAIRKELEADEALIAKTQ